MGVVYLAYDRELDRRVAVKVIKERPEGTSPGEWERRRTRLSETIRLTTEIIRLQTLHFGADNPGLTLSHGNLARQRGRAGDLEAAIASARRAVHIDSR